MEEKDLLEIEARMSRYPLEARQDIVQLVNELRRREGNPAAAAVAFV